jgi:hypothetical protein
MMERMRVLLLASCAALLVGCATAVAPSAPASSVPSASNAAGSSSASASVPAPSSGLITPHDDQALEDVLPDEFAGRPLTKLSVGPISSAGNPGAEPIKALAREIGDGTGNFGLAFAHDPSDPTFNFVALRIPGAAAADLVRRFNELTLAETTRGTSDTATVAGKQTTHVAAPGNTIGDSWFYATGDTLYGIQAGSVDMAERLLALLP